MLKVPSAKESLPRSYFAMPTAEVAVALLGCAFLRRVDNEWTGGLIVETEAYLPRDDLASHSARGRTKSNESMFGVPGILYVYPIHAKHCVNIVTEKAGLGCAVLIRAIEPVWGIEAMMGRRGRRGVRELTSGPGMICQAMGIQRDADGSDSVTDRNWRITPSPIKNASSIRSTRSKRIGISKHTERPLRFFVDGNRFVSGKASDHDRPRRDHLSEEGSIESYRNPTVGVRDLD